MWGFFYICHMIRHILFFVLIPFFVTGQSAFISGNDTICDNSQDGAEVSVAFSGVSPFSFVFSIDGVTQAAITTTVNPYIISTKDEGNYMLVSYNDANSFGSISGSALVTVLESPNAIIHLASDTLSVIYPLANFVSQSEGNIVSWDWSFGDNTINEFSSNASHLYKDSLAIYQANLIVIDANGCSDTASRVVFVINNEQDESYSMWIPNSFTPNNEDPNNEFCIEFNSIQEATFIFKVYNFQGDLMYQSTTPNSLRCCINPPDCSEKGGWDGKHYLTNKDLPSDTYIYEMYYKEEKGWKHKEYGQIVLVR